ncbi:uncharacterized protein [Nicotiana sylvestris]|uniref:uncharacterized protein n=1 Tax=Nicotiana sylvestris TaxID=4096 RepID=UPI00388CEB84
MKIALRAKRKLGFINGTCTKDQFTNDLGEDWGCFNVNVSTWIMNIVSSELVNGIVYASNAHEVWTNIQDRFDKINGSRIYNLHREIATVSQCTSSIFAYHSRLKLLWDEYSAIIATLHESQRKVCMTNTPMNEVDDSSALMSSRDNPKKFKRYGNLYCEYCRTKGHNKDTCYKLVGDPHGFKGKKKQEYGKSNAAMGDGFHAKDDMFQATTITYSNVERQGMSNYFTDEQYNQIIKLLNQDKGEEFAANMAGNTDSPLTQTCDIPWIIDTGRSFKDVLGVFNKVEKSYTCASKVLYQDGECAV